MVAKHRLTGHQQRVTCVMHITGNTLLSGSADSTLRVWDAAKGECVGVLDGHTGGVVCLCRLDRLGIHPRVVSGGMDGTLRVWNVEANRGVELAVLEGHS